VYYQVYDKEQKLFTQAQVDSTVQQKLKEEQDKQAAQPPVKETVKETYIFVGAGQSAGNVADMLVRSGVIADRAAFVELMARQQLNDKIIAGVHAFTGGPLDPTQVASILTTR
jgi:cell division protein YceG involved in septum cleavage